MTTMISFQEQLSEQWLLERTYHARLRDGRELSVPDLTQAMKQLIDFYIPLSTQSWKSKLPERVPLKKSSTISVPISAWREISQEEAQTTYQQGIPVLLYSEHAWEYPKDATETWRANKNMQVIISGKDWKQAEAVSGTDYAVCYLDVKRRNGSNVSWRAWFPSDADTIFNGSDRSSITFLGPSIQFPSTTHYTVIASDEQVHTYADRAEAIEGFSTLPTSRVSNGSQVQVVFPQFCYYHEVTCPSGVYRLEFFGPRMDEQGYQVMKGRDNGKAWSDDHFPMDGAYVGQLLS